MLYDDEQRKSWDRRKPQFPLFSWVHCLHSPERSDCREHSNADCLTGCSRPVPWTVAADCANRLAIVRRPEKGGTFALIFPDEGIGRK